MLNKNGKNSEDIEFLLFVNTNDWSTDIAQAAARLRIGLVKNIKTYV